MKTLLTLICFSLLCFIKVAFSADKVGEFQEKYGYLYGVKLKNGKFEQPSFKSFIEWVDSELKNNGAEQFGFRRAVLANGIPDETKINLVADFREVELGYLLNESDVLLRSGWKYEFGVLTFFPYEGAKWRYSELQLDSPILHGIDFSNGDLNAVRDAITKRIDSLGVRSVHVVPDGIKAKWNLEKGLLSLSLTEADWEAIYSLDRLMRLGSSIDIAGDK